MRKDPAPRDRSLRVLPSLEARRRELELCTYCPKLCRAACPVSNAEPNESLIPWGKMQGTFLAARGDLPIEDVAHLPYACTGCGGCRKRCDHENPVADTLADARAEVFVKGLAPAEAKRAVAAFPRHVERTKKATAKLGRGGASRTALLVGCAYTRALPDVALDLVRATEALTGGPVRLVQQCCGIPLRDAGDLDGFRAAQHALVREVGSAERIVAGDPSCALSLRRLGVEVTPFVALAHAAKDRLRPLPPREVTFHDPCSLGRGLGLYDEPRAVLEAVLGGRPRDFLFTRERSGCSGGGGLLTATMPRVAARIAKDRVAEAEGEIVTACAKSVLQLRRGGGRVTDLATLVRASLGA